jgi:nicotinate phosphoribosyltransferase
MLDAAGFPDAIISASNDLDELLIDSLKAQGAAITSWGVGTNLITSKDNPSFGGVYKLAAIQDENGVFIPKIKLSETSEKVTNPGNKMIYRIYDKATNKIKADLICLVGETYDEEEDLVLFDPKEPWKKTRLSAGSYTIRPIMEQIFKDGECVYNAPSLEEVRAYCNEQVSALWEEVTRFENPHKYYVDFSGKLWGIKQALIEKITRCSDSEE